MSKISRRINGATLAISTAVIVATAVGVEWPFLRVSTTHAGSHCAASNLADCGVAATQSALRLAQIAYQAVMPSLRDERRLPAIPGASEPAPVERMPGAEGAAATPKGSSAPQKTETGPRKALPTVHDDAEARARELARQLARSIAGSAAQ